MCKISVVVPVYNCERLVGRCINSILDQTFTDFELIIVDDGSRDSSLSVCQDIAQGHDNVYVYTKSNGGGKLHKEFWSSKGNR